MKLSARQKKKTVLRTVRISEELDAILEKDAKSQRISVNALISSIMAKYAEWDRFTGRFGHISIPTTLFRAFLDLTDENALATVAERFGVELTKQMISFWFKKISIETLLQFASIACEYAKVGEVEIQKEDRDYTITIYHEYGKKWSTFLARYIDKAWRTYGKVIPQFDCTENTVTYRFQAP